MHLFKKKTNPIVVCSTLYMNTREYKVGQCKWTNKQISQQINKNIQSIRKTNDTNLTQKAVSEKCQ